MPRATLLAVLALAGCVARGEPPLRDVETAEDRLFLRCVAIDPLFVTEPCRRFRDELNRDPYPGLAGR
jgi:hypothetical protein